MKIFNIHITKSGIEFHYHGDDVLYIWFWRRKGGSRFISWGFNDVFDSLAEIDKAWNEYEELIKSGR